MGAYYQIFSGPEVLKVLNSNTNLSPNYKCFSCGANHLRSSCTHLKYVCHLCKREGHIAKVCKFKSATKSRSRSNSRPSDPKSLNQVNVQDPAYAINQVSSSDIRVLANVFVSGFSFSMEVDSGSSVSTISEFTYNAIIKLKPLPLKGYFGILTGASNNKIATLGNVHLQLHRILKFILIFQLLFLKVMVP